MCQKKENPKCATSSATSSAKPISPECVISLAPYANTIPKCATSSASENLMIGFLCRREFYYLELLGTHMIGFLCSMIGFLCRMIGFLCRKHTKPPVESGLPFEQPA